jgi:hypothetical protein
MTPQSFSSRLSAYSTKPLLRGSVPMIWHEPDHYCNALRRLSRNLGGS